MKKCYRIIVKEDMVGVWFNFEPEETMYIKPKPEQSETLKATYQFLKACAEADGFEHADRPTFQVECSDDDDVPTIARKAGKHAIEIMDGRVKFDRNKLPPLLKTVVDATP